MRKYKRYTEEELFKLEQSWGKVSVETIAKKLNRTPTAIKSKAFKIGLSGMLDCKDYLIASDIANILNTDRKTIKKHITERGLKARKKFLTKGRQVICIEYSNFIEWLENNPNHWNSAKCDALALEMMGINKDFLERKIKEDKEKLDKTSLSTKDIESIKELYKKYYTYDDIAKKLNKNYSTIKWKIHTLIEQGKLEQNTKEGRLVRRSKRENYGWEKWQDEVLIRLYIKEGKTLKEISEIVGKSLSATKSRNQVLTRRLMNNMAI